MTKLDKGIVFLNIDDQVDLQNGFRYIKELLLQYQNYKMYRDLMMLKYAGISVYSVKNRCIYD